VTTASAAAARGVLLPLSRRRNACKVERTLTSKTFGGLVFFRRDTSTLYDLAATWPGVRRALHHISRLFLLNVVVPEILYIYTV
jgi:hypothetical protein